MRKTIRYKYTGVESGRQIRHLARMILSAYYNDELILIVVHGKQGYGKSTYVSIVLAQVYGVYIRINKLLYEMEQRGELEGLSGKEIRKIKLDLLQSIYDEKIDFTYEWKQMRTFFVFKPRQFLTVSRDQKVKMPCCVVDDAGLWLNTMDYHSPEVKATGKILEVARTIWGAIIFTCSDQQQIFSKIRNMPHVYTVRISKASGNNQRIARIFRGWISEDLKKHGRKTIAIDMFYPEMPGDIRDKNSFYGWYIPMRKSLTDTGFDELEQALNKLGIE